MIDIHCHILPGIDDGAEDLRTAIEMARLAYEDGIRHIVATPHFNSIWFNPMSTVTRLVAEVQKALERENIGITVHPGSEVRLETADFVYRHTTGEQFCYLAGNPGFVLLEQLWTEFNIETPEVTRWFNNRGTTVIIPHPERHAFFRDEPELLVKLIDAGVWTQVSVDSLLGKNTDAAQAFAVWLIKNNYAHTLATDAHNLYRKPNLSSGFKIVADLAGQAQVEEMKNRAERILSIG